MIRLLPLLLLLPFYSLAQSTPFVPDDRTYYGLIDRGSGRCLDIAGASPAAGAAAVQWEFTHAPSQQWRFVPVRLGSEYYRIEARHSTLCLTLDKLGESLPLVQRPFQGSEQQQWKLVPAGPPGSFQLENKAEGRVAALASTDKFNGTAVVAQKPTGRATQQWRLFGLRLNVVPGPSAFGPAAALGGINSTGSELAPVLAPDGNALYFARTKFAGNTEGNADTGDCWYSTSTDGGQGQNWTAPVRLDALSTPQDNAVVSIVGSQGQTLLVRGTYERDGTFRDEGLSRVARAAATSRAGRPEALRITNYYTATPGAGFFMSADEQVLLLSLERGDSQGAKDLYFSRPDGAGGWTEPTSMGPVLNSPGWDFAPWLTPDGQTLYFASYGHMGYGSADIFMSRRLDASWKQWSEPLNLGPGLNGPGFNAYFSLTPDGKTAFFSSSATANGTADIWRAAFAPVSDSAAAAAANAPLAVTDARAFLSGRVLDARTRQPVVGAEVKAILLPNAQGVQFNATGRADNSGSYQLSLLAGRYRLSASGGGLLTTADTLLVTGSPRRDLLLVPAAVGAKVELPSIIFAQGKAGLLASSYAELNRLAIALQAAPTTEVRLEGHTDNVGPADKNQQLSEDRVMEVKRYLVSRGVDEQRITTIGYGGSRPRYPNEREETRKLNRRVELVIVK